MQLWRTTYRSAGTESIGGLTLRETLWYLMMAETIMLSKPRVSRTIAESVLDGSIAYLLNKPYNYLLYVDPEIPRFLSLLFGQILWLSIIGLVVILLYKRGITRLSINGG